MRKSSLRVSLRLCVLIYTQPPGQPLPLFLRPLLTAASKRPSLTTRKSFSEQPKTRQDKRVLIQVLSAAFLARPDSYAARKVIADKLDGVDITIIFRLKATRTALSCSAAAATPGWSIKSNLSKGTTLAASANITRPSALNTHAALIAASEETSTTGPTAKTARHPFAMQTTTARAGRRPTTKSPGLRHCHCFCDGGKRTDLGFLTKDSCHRCQRGSPSKKTRPCGAKARASDFLLGRLLTILFSVLYASYETSAHTPIRHRGTRRNRQPFKEIQVCWANVDVNGFVTLNVYRQPLIDPIIDYITHLVLPFKCLIEKDFNVWHDMFEPKVKLKGRREDLAAWSNAKIRFAYSAKRRLTLRPVDDTFYRRTRSACDQLSYCFQLCLRSCGTARPGKADGCTIVDGKLLDSVQETLSSALRSVRRRTDLRNARLARYINDEAIEDIKEKADALRKGILRRFSAADDLDYDLLAS
ncbi:hypothetical protein MBM_00064 [Drepanopeziza brunnea f. sp. 'multigermtubi' MB_m1]|uniref:Uncharacterized protein n=1 Tax=Marssonina brunnea f. sp. multigermtubi (strain MB_m1) TaxID=1072389 RepID=K1X774_MARBU|nr:uncharacterized protein MBM_00064 [Drepanopeziza brunnea f. sp. 'multigermtubi' MB_m1]EKD20951.1 hypothetical protein MBM_00064 [Drepanopeziza brunnea f. sp. 'multigermtubi' MB_m1]